MGQNGPSAYLHVCLVVLANKNYKSLYNTCRLSLSRYTYNFKFIIKSNKNFI